MAGITKEQRAAKKTLSTINELQDLVNNDILEAYRTISTMSRDTTIPASVRKSAAMEVLKMGWLFSEMSEKTLEEPENREEERIRENAGNVTSMFLRHASK